jgi:hypothetical protein
MYENAQRLEILLEAEGRSSLERKNCQFIGEREDG